MKKLIPFLLIMMGATLTFAQNGAICGTDVLHKNLMKTDATYKAKYENNQKKIKHKLLAKNASGKQANVQYTVPVVVHVIHLGEPVGTGTNISDFQILSAITNLNDAFSGSGDYVTDMNINFVLAKRDINCNPTTGIVRVNGSGVANYENVGIGVNNSNGNEQTIKNLSRYPNDEYYNIWVVSEILDNNGGSGIQGFAYYPGSSPALDGAVVLYNNFGYDPNDVFVNGTSLLGYKLKSHTNLNATLIHEMGHAFNLNHTFEGDDSNGDGSSDRCPPNGNPSSDGDKCADTAPHMRNTQCGNTGETCGGSGTDLADIVTNFMGYSSQECQVKFSQDQRDRARASLETTRLALTKSSGGLAPSPSPSAVLSSTPATRNLSNGLGLGVYELTVGDKRYSSASAVNDGGYKDNSSCFGFNLSGNTTYNIGVKTGTILDENVKVYIDYNNDGDFVDSGEEVFSSTNAKNHSGDFTVPTANVVGDIPLWIRVISDLNNIEGPNYEPQYGQAEDFFVVINNLLSVNNNALANELKIYPNPNNGEFTINYKGALGLERLSVFNVIGKEVASLSLKDFNNSKQIDISGIKAGMYFVKILSEESEVTKMIIIK